MRTLKFSLFLLSGIVLLESCGVSEKTSLAVAFRSVVSSLDPIRENTVISNSIYCNLYEPLVVRNPDLRITPALAIEWSNPDDRTWLFKLRPNVQFHDGNPLLAQDVRFSLERARTDPASQLVTSLAFLQRVEVVNQDTVRIITHKPYNILLSRLVDIWIVPHKSFSLGQHPSEIPGTGPYRLINWQPGKFVELSANPHYWGGKPRIERVRFDAVPDLKERLNLLKQNRAQIVPLLEPEALSDPLFKKNAKVQIQSTPGLTVLFLAMDVKREKTPHVDGPSNPFRDYRVRKAIYHAVNIQKIVKDILRGNAMEATQLTAPKVFGHSAAIRRLKYDPVLAKDLLKQAGYAAGFSVRFDVTNDRYRNDLEIGKSIAADLQAIGVRVRLNAVGIEVLEQIRARRDSSFQMAGWTLPSTDASGALDYLVHTSNPKAGYGIKNFFGYSNPQVDQIIEESAGSMDAAERAKLLNNAMELCMSELPYVPLHVENSVLASRKEVAFQPRSDEYLYVKSMRLSKRSK